MKPAASPIQRWQRRYWSPDPATLALVSRRRPITVVTGASEGIGRAIAGLLAKQGKDVLLIARQPKRLSEVAQQLQQTTASSVETLALDITQTDALDLLDAKLAELGASVDVLVNNAGVGLAGAFESACPTALMELVQLNVVATTRLLRHVLPEMLTRGHGGVLTIASLGAFAPGPFQAAYFASKAYQVALSEALAVETSGHGVTITCVAPGPVNTAFHAKMGTERALYRWLVPAMSAERVARQALLAYRWRLRTFVPGLLPGIGLLALKALPHRLTLGLLALLMRPRA